MSAAGTTPAFSQPVWQNILNGAKAGLLSGTASALQQLSTLGIGLADAELNDFNTFVTNYTQDIEAGMTPAAAWAKEWAPYASQAKSDAWNAVMGALEDGLSFLGGLTRAIEAAI